MWHQNISDGMLAKLLYVIQSVVICGQCSPAADIYILYVYNSIMNQSGPGSNYSVMTFPGKYNLQWETIGSA